MTSKKSEKKTAFITGGAGGLGGATARYLAERDWHVFAADFAEEALEVIGKEKGITPIHLDVTDTASVQAAAESVSGQVDGLDGVVNFAGILAVGSMIEMEEQALARVLEVNVMGTFRVNQAFFPLVLVRKGRIINISSETGWQSGMPFNGAYAMSKHAIEAYSDSLRRELMFLEIPVIKIQPGPFKTDMVASIERNFSRAAEESTHFHDLLTKLKSMTVHEQEKANDPSIIAEAVHKALTSSITWPAYSVKADRQRAAMSYLPDWVLDPILKLVLGR